MTVAADPLVLRLVERFVAADTSVLPGETRVDPLDPRMTAFAREVVAPELADLGASVEIDALNNVIATFGPGSGELMLMSDVATHHANEMHEPLHARVREHDGERRGAAWARRRARPGWRPRARPLRGWRRRSSAA